MAPVTRSSAAWKQFVAEIHNGLEAVGISRDFFGFDDLMALAQRRYTASMVIALAKASVAAGMHTTPGGTP